jgi:hypothetical protein
MACNLAGSVGTCTNIPNGQDPANECAGATTCNGSAACGLFALGAACSANGECSSGNCVDGVRCTTSTCSGTCKSCNQADTVGAVAGVCDFIKANSDPGNECTTECNGAGACEAPAGTSCSTGAECQSGNCVDGVCCGSSSCAACQACNVAGNLGTCTNIAVDGTDNNPVGTCTGNNACDGTGTCKKKDGQACSGSNAECVHNHCTDGFCCDLACGGTCEACSAALSGGSDGVCGNLIPNTDPANECTGAQVCSMMGTCVTAPNGATCPVNGTDNNCTSTFCVDGVCCSGVCDLKCEACTNALTGGTTGTCTGIPAGQDPQDECPGANVCDGNHGCQ